MVGSNILSQYCSYKTFLKNAIQHNYQLWWAPTYKHQYCENRSENALKTHLSAMVGSFSNKHQYSSHITRENFQTTFNIKKEHELLHTLTNHHGQVWIFSRKCTPFIQPFFLLYFLFDFLFCLYILFFFRVRFNVVFCFHILFFL